MTADEFRRIALGMEGAVESAHMNHPDFRINGRIFATLQADEQRGMVALTPELQQQFMRASGAFSPASGAWGRGGSTMVLLSAIDEETLGEAITVAWRLAIDKGAARGSTKTKAKRRKAITRKPKRRSRKG